MAEITDVMDAKVSVLMSVYNEPIEWVEQAIDSILTQTVSDFEFIIVNDAPHRKDLKSYLVSKCSTDKRIKIVNNESNLGLTKSLNVGLQHCKGEYIARMDADDFSLPERLQKQVQFMDENTDVVASSAMAIAWNGIRTGEKLIRPLTNEDFQEYLFTSSPFIHPLLIIRRSILTRNDLSYDETYKVSQDYKLAADLNRIGKIVNIPDVLLHYRVSNSQISKSRGKEQEENGRRIRRELINDYYSRNGFRKLSAINLETLKDNYLYAKKMSSSDKKIMNCIRRVIYYSLENYSFETLLRFLFSGDYFHSPYNFRRFAVVLVKHVKNNIVPSLI